MMGPDTSRSVLGRQAARSGRLAGALAVSLLLSACGETGEPAVDPPPGTAAIPHPDLSAADPALRERLDSERARLEELLAAAVEDELLATGFGAMGRLYQAHDFLDPAAACYKNAVRLAPDEFQWRYYLGSILQHQGDLDEAATELRAAIALEPKDAAALLRLADVERARRRPEAARPLYERALEAEPRCWAAGVGLAEAARDRGDLQAAADHYLAVLARQPEAHRLHYPLAQTLLRLGRKEEAELHLRQTSERGPAAGGGVATCPDPLDDELQLLMTGAPIHLDRGRLAAAAGDLERELVEYRKAVRLAPDLPIALQILGRALAQRGENTEALELYERAARLEPQNADLRHDLGLLYLHLERPEDALKSFREALALRPDHLEARLQLAALTLRQGRAVEALELYDRILETDPAQPAARLQRAVCLVQLGRRQEAVTDLGKLLDAQPPADPVGRLRLAMAIGALGDGARALEHLDAVLELGADLRTRVEAHTAMAALLEQRGDLDLAAEHRAAAQALAAGSAPPTEPGRP